MRPDCTLNNTTKPPQTTKNVRLPFLYCFLTRGTTARETKLKRTTAQTKENNPQNPTDATHPCRRRCNPPTDQKRDPEKHYKISYLSFPERKKRKRKEEKEKKKGQKTGAGAKGLRRPGFLSFFLFFFFFPFPFFLSFLFFRKIIIFIRSGKLMIFL